MKSKFNFSDYLQKCPPLNVLAFHLQVISVSIASEEPLYNAWACDLHMKEENYFLGTTPLTQIGCRKERMIRYPSNESIKYCN